METSKKIKFFDNKSFSCELDYNTLKETDFESNKKAIIVLFEIKFRDLKYYDSDIIDNTEKAKILFLKKYNNPNLQYATCTCEDENTLHNVLKKMQENSSNFEKI